jgi:enamine deaminase RidA (YjgF/YER057c/UK114 family)
MQPECRHKETRRKHILKMKVAHILAFMLASSAAFAQMGDTVKHIQTDKAAIASGVWVGNTYYLSGTMPNAISPADAAKGTPAVYGDTKTQTFSSLSKIQASLKDQGLTMGDVVVMHVYMAGDPANGGKLDFTGMNASYSEFFGTKDQPNKPARSAMQVAALVAPGALVEIEVVAVKQK